MPKVYTGNCNNATVELLPELTGSQYAVTKRISLVNANNSSVTVNLYKKNLTGQYKLIAKDTVIASGESLEITDPIYLLRCCGFVLVTGGTIDYDFNLEINAG